MAGRSGPLDDPYGNDLSQVLGTTPGQTYDLSFSFAQTALSTTELVIRWDGNPVRTFVNPTTDVCDFDSPSSQYTCRWLQLVVLGLTASSNSTLLQVIGQQNQGYLLLDDFVVDNAAGPGGPEPATVPEPTSVVLLGSGLVALAARYRRRLEPRRRL